VEQAVHDFEAVEPPHPTDIFDHMYKDMPWHLREEKEEMLRHLGESER
jgi:TPP-dependent pyruvate/acetoin dehydrogenase alpha subunit